MARVQSRQRPDPNTRHGTGRFQRFQPKSILSVTYTSDLPYFFVFLRIGNQRGIIGLLLISWGCNAVRYMTFYVASISIIV